MRPLRQRNGLLPSVGSPHSNRWRVIMSIKERPYPIDGDHTTSSGAPWSDVPEFARHHVVWIDGRHGPAMQSLPTVEVEPIPEILNQLPRLHPSRPRGSRPMFDCGGARARLRAARPRAWLVSPSTGWKWAKWPDGEVGWVAADIQLPDCLRVRARNDLQ
jgi:hypothetical protein